MAVNSYTQFIDFPFEKLIPNGGVIRGTETGFEAGMLLMPFKLLGERIETQFTFTSLQLPDGGPEIWAGNSYDFPAGTATGFIDLLGKHTLVTLKRADFGPWREPFIEATFHFDFVFRMDGPWLRDVSLVFSTVLEYQPAEVEAGG